MDAPCCDRLLEGVLVEPRDYQRRVVGRVIEMFSGPHVDRKAELPEARSVIVESPTGSGKTVMGLLVARWAQEQLGMRVVWAAMRRNLLAQANRENLARGFGVNLQTVSMFDKNPPRGDLLVVDEAQHDATTSMASLHAAVAPAKVLGLSATPWRADRLGLCFERTVRDAGIRQLVLEGYLSPFAHYTIPEWSPAAVAETWLREPARWGRSSPSGDGRGPTSPSTTRSFPRFTPRSRTNAAVSLSVISAACTAPSWMAAGSTGRWKSVRARSCRLATGGFGSPPTVCRSRLSMRRPT